MLMTDYLTVPEAAAALRCHPETILRAIRHGRMRATFFGGRYLIEPKDMPAKLAPRKPSTGRRRGDAQGPVTAALREREAAR